MSTVFEQLKDDDFSFVDNVKLKMQPGIKTPPKWLNGEELLAYIAITVYDLPVKGLVKAMKYPLAKDCLTDICSQIKRVFKLAHHFNLLRCQPIAILEANYVIDVHEDRAEIVCTVKISTPEQRDLRDIEQEFRCVKFSHELSEDELAVALRDTHNWVKGWKVEITQPETARKQIAAHEAKHAMTMEEARDIFNAKTIHGKSDWQIKELPDKSRFLDSSHGRTYTEAEAIAAAGSHQ